MSVESGFSERHKKNALLPEPQTTAPYFWVVPQSTQYVGPAGADSGITRARAFWIRMSVMALPAMKMIGWRSSLTSS